MRYYILVHGAWEASGMWDNVSPILRRSGYAAATNLGFMANVVVTTEDLIAAMSAA